MTRPDVQRADLDVPQVEALDPDWSAVATWAALMVSLVVVTWTARVVAGPTAAVLAGTAVMGASLAAAYVAAAARAVRRHRRARTGARGRHGAVRRPASAVRSAGPVAAPASAVEAFLAAGNRAAGLASVRGAE